ncbi:Uncharacterised protein g1191 [Pycnogonum litorale]
MTRRLAIVIRVFILLSSCLQFTYQASFYGSSYVKLPLQDASSSTNVYIRFKTYRANSLLFLAAGSTDYCLVILDSGSVKVRINLGAGETELSSSPSLHLDDLVWHEIEIQRDDAEMSLIIDGKHTTHLFIPGQFYELNVHYGLFVGGLGNFKDLFLGNLEYFRGCMDEVSFNDYDVLGSVQDGLMRGQSHQVTWDCSDEFDAVGVKATSFMESGAFMALPRMTSRDGHRLTFDIKTQSETAILMYHSGKAFKSDFVAIELVNGLPQLLVNDGNGMVSLSSNVTVSDGYWHKIGVSLTTDEHELIVDGLSGAVKPTKRDNDRIADLDGFLYIGGIELNKQSVALRQGLESVDQKGTESSMKGCVRNLVVDKYPKGLMDAKVTKGLRSGCLWKYPCLSNPCVDGADCYQESHDDFRCFCEAGELCIRRDYNMSYTLYTKSTLPVDMKILSLHPLQVPEGGSELLTTDHIEVLLDYQRYNVKEEGIRFHIVQPPRYGVLEVEMWQHNSENIFTLLDLTSDKMRYTHYGSDDLHDTMTIDLEFVAQTHRLPSFLEHRLKFVFHINVSPVNDPPKLVIPADNVFHLAAQTKRLLTSDYLSANDTDTSADKLVYKVVSFGTGNLALIENVKNPDRPISTFTQQDVNNGLISYNHRGVDRSARIALQVSDGEVTSQTAVLHVSTFDLEIDSANNTGLTVIHGASALFSSHNLTFVTNAVDQELDISYDVTRMPQHGTVQKLKTSKGRWQATSRFTQKQINNGYVRYLHVGQSQPERDEFRFVVSCAGTKISTVHNFNISFITVAIYVVGSKMLTLKHVEESILSIDEVDIHTEPVIAQPSDIRFYLSTGPEYGDLMVYDHNLVDYFTMNEGDSFTQQQLQEGLVLFRLKWRMYVSVNDTFEIVTVTPGGIRNNAVINVWHEPRPSDVRLTIDTISVGEGQRVIVTSRNLMVSQPNVTNFYFNISELPRHGQLCMLNKMLTKTAVHNPRLVTGEQISDSRFVYVHDDSEHSSDSIHFVATAESVDTIVHGVVHIEIKMRNDNPPFRVFDDPFYVVRYGQRIITTKDLQYADIDENTKSSDIQYTRRSIPNGVMVSSDSPDEQIYQFTQEDIDMGRILFKHNSEDYGRAILWVTDGQYYTTGILEINASSPFLRILNNTEPIVKHGDSKTIESSHLAVITNIDVTPTKITYTIVKQPKYGQLTRAGVSCTEFSQQDVDDGQLDYESDTSYEFTDSFEFKVSVEKVENNGVFRIKLYPESYWKPFVVVNNNTLNISEGKWKYIDSSILKIRHDNIDPPEIRYKVVAPPKHGAVYLDNIKHVTLFNQSTIDNNQLKYEEYESDVTDDVIRFDVTNGVITLRSVSLLINILPSRVYLVPKLLKVVEGDRIVLDQNDFVVGNRYYRNNIRDYLITTKPKYGRLKNKRKPKKRISRFSPSQLRRGFISYVHDGSERQKDRFSIVAVIASENGMIRSAPVNLDVMILPVDDRAPTIVNNTGLRIWAGSTVTVTNDILAASDVDSKVSDIFFKVTKKADVGYFGLKSSPDQFLTSIPQIGINNGDVLFFHTGNELGTFEFVLTDGVNDNHDLVKFNVIAKPIQLSVEHNQRLQVFPRMKAVISSRHLTVNASGNILPNEIHYDVTRAPSHGKLLIQQENSMDHVTDFTQREIDDGLIVYQSTGRKFANDTIVFSVSHDNSNKILSVSLNVEISGKISNENLKGAVNAVEVEEGGREAITDNNINLERMMELLPLTSDEYSGESTRLVVESLPQHGYLMCKEKQLTADDSKCRLKVDDLANRVLIYQHDHSDTFGDKIDFTVRLASTKTSIVDLVNITLDIDVTPVNDNRFVLMTRSPRLSVVFGQSVQISREHLFTGDPDGLPDEISYDIISGPNNGYIAIESTGGHTKRVERFSQGDIGKGWIYFVHDGTTNKVGLFNFKVSDGNPNHGELLETFTVDVQPLYLTLQNRSASTVLQGSTTSTLTDQNIGVRTNGNHSRTWFDVDIPPIYGKLLLDGVEIDRFRQIDIDEHRVTYNQTDMSGSEDNFTLTVTNLIAKLDEQVFEIRVKPLVRQSLPLLDGSTDSFKTFLSLSVLDASQLAHQTDSNPLYSIVAAPKFGKIRRIRERHYRSVDSPINTFTHEDVKNNIVYYESDRDIQKQEKDQFTYVLSAPNVQPAKGVIEIKVNPVQSASRPSPNNPSSTDAKNEVENTSMHIDYILITAVIVSILVLCIFIIVIGIKCFRNSKKKCSKNSSKNSVCKYNNKTVSDDLPPPPSHMSIGRQKKKHFKSRATTPPPLPMYSAEDDFAEISAAVPMCKVIPLTDPNDPLNVKHYDEPDSFYSDDLSSNGGIDNTNWGNMYTQETQFSPPSNPLLRKNQYWV